MATPEKALCDKVIATPRLLLRSVKQTEEYLVEDLRIEKSYLRDLNVRKINDWMIDAPKKSSISLLYKTLSRL